MSFFTKNASRHSAKPIAFLAFYVGPGNVLRFVSGDQPKDYDIGDDDGIQEYLPITVSLPQITQTGNLDKTPFKIVLPQELDLAQRFLIYPPANEVTVIVHYGDQGETDASHAFTGTVLSCKRKRSGKAEMNCEPVMSGLRRPGLQRTCQPGCGFVLGDGVDCKADLSQVETSIVTATVNSSSIDFLAGWNGAIDIEKYLGGKCSWPASGGGLEVRNIIGVSSTSINLGGPIRDLVALASVTLSPGCDRVHTGDCLTLHKDALGNPVIHWYGGQDFIPDEDPYHIQHTFYGGTTS